MLDSATPTRPEGFQYSPTFPLAEDTTPYRRLPIEGVKVIEVDGKRVLKVPPKALEELAFAACRDVSHLLRPGHLTQHRWHRSNNGVQRKTHLSGSRERLWRSRFAHPPSRPHPSRTGAHLHVRRLHQGRCSG